MSYTLSDTIESGLINFHFSFDKSLGKWDNELFFSRSNKNYGNHKKHLCWYQELYIRHAAIEPQMRKAGRMLVCWIIWIFISLMQAYGIPMPIMNNNSNAVSAAATLLRARRACVCAYRPWWMRETAWYVVIAFQFNNFQWIKDLQPHKVE